MAGTHTLLQILSGHANRQGAFKLAIRKDSFPNADQLADSSIGPAVVCHLARAKQGAFPYVDQPQDKSEPRFETVEQLLASHPEVADQMRNKVKKCASCQKPNAFTLATCNQCGADLGPIELSFTPNIFMAFVYGVAKGAFPFVISLRSQTPELMVFDDLLALSACHLNVIPSAQFIPDWRFLLKRPKEGLALLNKMFDACWEVCERQFLASPGFREKMLQLAPTGAGEGVAARLKAAVIAGANYPPSQYQLHLQWMLAPLLPFQQFQFVAGVHYTHMRFFPLEYLRAVLELDVSFDTKEDTPIEELVAFYASLGVNYDKYHAAAIARYEQEHLRYSNWSVDDFEAVVIGNGNVVDLATLTIGNAEEVSKVRTADKTTLQNYGRPYENGRPSGTYYKHAKQVGSVESWV